MYPGDPSAAPNPLARAGGFKLVCTCGLLNCGGTRSQERVDLSFVVFSENPEVDRTRSQERVDLSTDTVPRSCFRMGTRSQERVDLSDALDPSIVVVKEPARKSGWI